MKFSKIVHISTILAASLTFANTAQATDGKAYTWISKIYDHGTAPQPDWALVGTDSVSNAYKGDASPKAKLPLLCIMPKAKEPANYRTAIGAGYKSSYHGWSGEKIGLTKSYPVNSISSAAHGDKICRKHYRNKKARWAQHHDNKVGGWNLGGEIHPKSASYGNLKPNCGKVRFMVWIKNQPANPWNQ